MSLQAIQAGFPKLFRHLEGAQQAQGFPEVQAKLNAATPRLKTFVVPQKLCYPLKEENRWRDSLSLPTLIVDSTASKNFAS